MHAQGTRPLSLRATGEPEAPNHLTIPSTLETVVLSGYGLKIAVHRRHLVVEDGVGEHGREGRFHKATTRLRRLVVIGHTGFVSLEALRWLRDAGVAFVQIDADGTLIASFAPEGTNDVARRRAQLAAASTETGAGIVRWLLTMKLRAQVETLARFQPANTDARTAIELAAGKLETENLDEMRWYEAVAASAYWTALASLPVRFPRAERLRLPAHWTTVGPRTSPLTNSPRLAVTPFQAMDSYVYAIAENEARVAIRAAGLDPEVGLLHAERRARASFAHDLIEPVRPEVDRFLLGMLESHTFSVRDFIQARDGHCRLATDLARMLANAGPRWAPRLATLLQSVIGMLEKGTRSVGRPRGARASKPPVAVRVGQLHRLTAGNVRPMTPLIPKTVCVVCGGALARGLLYCSGCRGVQQQESINAARPAALATIAALRADGRDPTHGGAAAARRRKAASVRQREVRQAGGRTQDIAASRELFDREIRPTLQNISIRKLTEATGLSPSYWSLVRRGKRVPHARHRTAVRLIAEGASRQAEVRT